MQFESIADFLAMGKHGIFVWSCYAVFAVILAINTLAPIMRRRKVIGHLRRIEKRQAGAQSIRPAG